MLGVSNSPEPTQTRVLKVRPLLWLRNSAALPCPKSLKKRYDTRSVCRWECTAIPLRPPHPLSVVCGCRRGMRRELLSALILDRRTEENNRDVANKTLNLDPTEYVAQSLQTTEVSVEYSGALNRWLRGTGAGFSTTPWVMISTPSAATSSWASLFVLLMIFDDEKPRNALLQLCPLSAVANFNKFLLGRKWSHSSQQPTYHATHVFQF